MIIHGDCLTALPALPADSFDACVTDPPYHLTSIVKRFGKPGSAPAKDGDVYARSSAGFMGKQWDGGDIAMRPETWAEVLRVLRPGAHLLAFGGTRTFHRIWCAIEDAGFEVRDTIMWLYGSGFPKSHNQGDGWGTALKPAFEPIILARKPLIGTVAANREAHRTGAINVEDCRVPGGDVGRWPANIIHDGSDEVLAAFPAAPGQIARAKNDGSPKHNSVYGKFAGHATGAPEPRTDAGSAARFFYCAKASRADRNEGCGALPDRESGMRSETSGQHITRRDGGDPAPTKNNHPTVKPEALMRYLVRLVTPTGGVVLDPFMGSGSTGRAAALEGFRFVGIEREDEYLPIAQARISAAEARVSADAPQPLPDVPGAAMEVIAVDGLQGIAQQA